MNTDTKHYEQIGNEQKDREAGNGTQEHRETKSRGSEKEQCCVKDATFKGCVCIIFSLLVFGLLTSTSSLWWGHIQDHLGQEGSGGDGAGHSTTGGGSSSGTGSNQTIPDDGPEPYDPSRCHIDSFVVLREFPMDGCGHFMVDAYFSEPIFSLKEIDINVTSGGIELLRELCNPIHTGGHAGACDHWSFYVTHPNIYIGPHSEDLPCIYASVLAIHDLTIPTEKVACESNVICLPIIE